MMRRLLIALAIILACASPAAAHKLKLFAAIEGDTIAGYAFFIGGGRAQDTPWQARDESGKLLGEGRTGPEGEFHLMVPEPMASDVTITVNTEEGHMATKTLAAARFGAPASPLSAAAVSGDAAPQVAFESQPAPVPAADMAALVEAAVQRQVTPLLERIEEMDSRLRYADILSGIFLIVGLAGIGLWARGRRK